MDNLRNWTVKKSTRRHKKYMARYKGPRAGRSSSSFASASTYLRTPWKHFGDTRYEHYRDTTPLRLYAHLDHLDRRRRNMYRVRHERDRHVVGSSGWLADKFLWS